MTERVVDVLEIVDVEERQREVRAIAAGLDRLLNQMAQPRTIGQAGQHVMIGEPRDLGPRFLALDRERAEVDAGIDDALMPARGRAAFPEIEGERSDHAAILALDR